MKVTRKANEMLDLLPEAEDNVSESFQFRITAETNVSKFEEELADAVLKLKTHSKLLATERAELDRLRSEKDSSNEDVRNQEALIRLNVADARKQRALCVATHFSGRVINLTQTLAVRRRSPSNASPAVNSHLSEPLIRDLRELTVTFEPSGAYDSTPAESRPAGF